MFALFAPIWTGEKKKQKTKSKYLPVLLSKSSQVRIGKHVQT